MATLALARSEELEELETLVGFQRWWLLTAS